MFRSMFEPSEAVYDAYGPLFDRLRAFKGRCISLTIRMGDEYLGSSKGAPAVAFDQVEPYFSCAQNATRDILARELVNGAAEYSEDSVPWFVNSDSVEVRRYALQRWGSQKVITNTEKAEHVFCDVEARDTIPQRVRPL